MCSFLTLNQFYRLLSDQAVACRRTMAAVCCGVERGREGLLAEYRMQIEIRNVQSRKQLRSIGERRIGRVFQGIEHRDVDNQ